MRTTKTLKFSNTPSHAILSPSDNDKVLNFINFDKIGSSTLTTSGAFRKIQFASKTTPGSLFNSPSEFSLKYGKINDLYLSNSDSQDSMYYGTRRQHNFNSISSLTNNFNSNLDNKSLNTMLSYNSGFQTSNSNSDLEIVSFGSNSRENDVLSNLMSSKSNSTISKSVGIKSIDKELSSKNSKAQDHLQGLMSSDDSSSLNSHKDNTLDSYSSSDKNLVYKSFYTKSPNQTVLPGERSVRNINLVNPTKNNLNFSGYSNSLGKDNYNSTNVGSSLVNSLGFSGGVENMSKMLLSMSTVFPTSHIPTGHIGNNLVNQGFDRSGSNNMAPAILSSKEELAPSYIFDSY